MVQGRLPDLIRPSLAPAVSRLLKRLWRIDLIRIVAWFPVVCLLLAVGLYIPSDRLWWDWGELLSIWLRTMETFGVLAIAVGVPGFLFAVASKWTARALWLRDEQQSAWKIAVGTVARTAGWIWVACLVGFVLWVWFTD